MPRGRQSKGACIYCAAEFAKGGALKHLASCAARRAVTVTAQSRQAGSETLHHLRVQDARRSEFWLHLEVRGSSTLKDVDFYLRRIWLECCGHMSQFSIGGWLGREIPKSRRVEEVFGWEGKLTHLYDFGTSSETLLRTVGLREGRPTTKHPVALMARNRIPEARCIDCALPAAWLCRECLTKEEKRGTLCDEHARAHPHTNYGRPIRLVNSPRLGMCAYDGPAVPPY